MNSAFFESVHGFLKSRLTSHYVEWRPKSSDPRFKLQLVAYRSDFDGDVRADARTRVFDISGRGYAELHDCRRLRLPT